MLSTYEMELVTNPEVILTKNRIIAKVYALFGDLSSFYQATPALALPTELTIIAPKIARGENYLGLPYVMLDYPRNFSRQSVFAVRTFFWSGNFFSLTLHISGDYLPFFSSKVENAIVENQLTGWYLSAGQNEWDHHFGQGNYLAINENTKVDIRLPFVKLAIKLPLSDWEDANGFLKEKYEAILRVLAD